MMRFREKWVDAGEDIEVDRRQKHRGKTERGRERWRKMERRRRSWTKMEGDRNVGKGAELVSDGGGEL